MKIPKISIILTSFNHEKYICEAIDSVLNQSFSDFELIIWDDASSDNSWYLIKQYSDPRIQTFCNEEQKRGIWGINKAISEVAKGEYIAIHHSDDVWESDKLEKQVAILEDNSEIGAVFTNAQAINDASESLAGDEHLYSYIFEQPNRTRFEWLSHFFSIGNALCHPSVLIRRECYEKCGLYRYGFAQLGDFDMWVRLCMKYEIYVLPEKLIRFRVRGNEGNSSGNTIEMRSRLYFEYYLVLKNYLKILSFSELVLIFPNAIKYKADKDENIEFVMSMILIEEGGFALSKVLALDLLFNIINDPVSSKLVSEVYGFNSMKFVDLTKKYGISNKLLADYEAEINERDAALAERERYINEIIGSLSWRITVPLRWLKSTLLKSRGDA